MITVRTHLDNAFFNGNSDSRVRGMVFAVTAAELAAADQCEVPAGNMRITATLASGETAGLYIDARAPRAP